MIGSTAGSHFASASSSGPVIQCGSVEFFRCFCSISYLGLGKNYSGRGLVSREDGYDCHFRRSQKLLYNER